MFFLPKLNADLIKFPCYYRFTVISSLVFTGMPMGKYYRRQDFVFVDIQAITPKLK
jgi:hypothetical protein